MNYHYITTLVAQQSDGVTVVLSSVLIKFETFTFFLGLDKHPIQFTV